MNTAITSDPSGRLNARRRWLTGLPRKALTIAPSGSVRMNALHSSNRRGTFVHKYRSSITASPAAVLGIAFPLLLLSSRRFDLYGDDLPVFRVNLDFGYILVPGFEISNDQINFSCSF
jgi:hypothetical protein